MGRGGSIGIGLKRNEPNDLHLKERVKFIVSKFSLVAARSRALTCTSKMHAQLFSKFSTRWSP